MLISQSLPEISISLENLIHILEYLGLLAPGHVLLSHDRGSLRTLRILIILV